MINVGHTTVGRFFVGATTFKALSMGSIYKGSEATRAAKIWEAISSCFGSGIWRTNKPWRGKDKWKY